MKRSYFKALAVTAIIGISLAIPSLRAQVRELVTLPSRAYTEIYRFEETLLTKITLDRSRRIIGAVETNSEMAQKISEYIQSAKGERVRYFAQWLRNSSREAEAGNYAEMTRLLRVAVAEMMVEVSDQNSYGYQVTDCELLSTCVRATEVYRPTEEEMAGKKPIQTPNLIKIYKAWWFWEKNRPLDEQIDFTGYTTLIHAPDDSVDPTFLSLAPRGHSRLYRIETPRMWVLGDQTQIFDFRYEFWAHHLRVDLVTGELTAEETSARFCSHNLKFGDGFLGCARVTLGAQLEQLIPAAAKSAGFGSVTAVNLSPDERRKEYISLDPADLSSEMRSEINSLRFLAK